MFMLVRNAALYDPSSLGRRDILVANSRILHIAESINPSGLPGPCETIDASSMKALPGFIDSHVHVTGGGGEGGFASRTPELSPQDALQSGVTTVVGTLGTDGVTRSMKSLVAKTYALREQGLSAFCYTGSYRVPSRTVTGDIMKDIMMIEPIIGVGELALSDHRSSQPSAQELSRIASEARVAGMLSGKAGVINIHVGDARAGLEPLEELVSSGEMPRAQFIPTHCNRNPNLFKRSIEWALSGGFVDLTSSMRRHPGTSDGMGVPESLRALMDAGVALSSVTCTSDGQGSLPSFDPDGTFQGMAVASCSSLWEAIRLAVLAEGLPLAEVLRTISSSPADALKLRSKGRIQPGMDADIVLVSNEDLSIQTVIALGRIVYRQ